MLGASFGGGSRGGGEWAIGADDCSRACPAASSAGVAQRLQAWLGAPASPPSILCLRQVRHGLAGAGYRTRLCPKYLQGAECSRGAGCSDAHSQQELRVDAAIAVSCRAGQRWVRVSRAMLLLERGGGREEGRAVPPAARLARQPSLPPTRIFLQAGLLPSNYKMCLCSAMLTQGGCGRRLVEARRSPAAAWRSWVVPVACAVCCRP